MRNGLKDILQNGDLLLVSGNGLFSKVIQCWTGGRWNHVGIVSLENGKPTIWEAALGKGVVETPLKDFLLDENSTVAFARIIHPSRNELITNDEGKLLVEWCKKKKGSKYDLLGDVGFIRELTHKLFKFLPVVNPFDDPVKYWCSELVRDAVIERLYFDLYYGIKFGFESPNDTVTQYPDKRSRVVVLNIKF